MTKRRGPPRKKREPGIGKFLTEIREAQGKTQKDIAVSLGKSRSIVCRIERGTRTEKSLQGILLYDLAWAYGIRIAELLKEANWTQLPLFDVTEEEMEQLVRYLDRIRRKNK